MTWYPQGKHPYVRDQGWDVFDRTALHQAASNGQVLLLLSIMDHGGDVNVTNCNGVTPLHDACQTGHRRSAGRMIDGGAKLNVMDIDWHTPLTRACSEGKKDCVELLVQSGAKLNINGEKFSPLHCAVAKGCLGSTNVLLNAGAQVNKLDHKRLGTPLHTAVHCHQTECAMLLLQSGADANATRPDDQQTALHVAASTSAPAETITLLLKHGTKLYAKDENGRTALDLAPQECEAYGILKNYHENVPLLSELCRESVNICLTKNNNSVESLPLPERIKAFLDFKN